MLGLGQWLIDLDSLDLAIAGFFWLLTPPRDITFVHAVQQPLADPLLTPTNPAPRDPGTTFTYFGGTATIHTRSTEKLDLIASWVDRLDDPRQTRSASAHVFEVPIPEKATNPPPTDLVPIATYGEDTVTFQAKPAGDQSRRKFLSRHEFGDTKHRQVTYNLIATSRFREYFPQKIGPLVTDFSRTGNAVVVNVLSSVRPPAPGVLYALPVFEWTRTTHPDGSQSRVRKPSGIRVYLERPWYASGDGEMLAVVLADPSDYPPDQKLAPCVTQWGLDPIWKHGQQTGNVTAAPLPRHFGGVAVSGLALGELAGSPTRVAIAAHGVEFESNRKLWYCDIPVDPGSVYCPFVRLALARYQQQSIPGLELSGVVLADFVQLLPQRTVSVQPVPGDPNSFTFALTGLTYAGSTWTPGPWPMPYYFPDGDPNEQLLQDPPDHTPPYRIHVSLEQRIPGAQDDAGWQPAVHVAGAQVLVQSVAESYRSGTDSLWSGKVTLPAGRLPGQFRAVIREYEQLFTDVRIVDIVRVHVDASTPPRPKPAFIDKRPLTWAPGGPVGPGPNPGRMVFAETIEL
jgi:hypothetical protein